MIQVNLFTKQKEIHRHRKWIYGYQRGNGMWEGQITSLELANANYYIQNRQTTVYITRNYTRYFIIAYKGKESENEYMYIYIYTHTHTHRDTHITETVCCTSN